MITVGNQIADMARIFPDWSCDQSEERTAIWIGYLRPHQTTYKLRVEYTEPLLPEGRSSLYLQPLVEVLDPILQPRFGNPEGLLPHIYLSHPRTQRPGPFLCLFDDEAREWSPEDLISNTTIPWAANWLSCYESWRATGIWFGSGKHLRAHTNGRSGVARLMERYNATTSIPAFAGNNFPPPPATRMGSR